jgi:hypothetical protein
MSGKLLLPALLALSLGVGFLIGGVGQRGAASAELPSAAPGVPGAAGDVGNR